MEAMTADAVAARAPERASERVGVLWANASKRIVVIGGTRPEVIKLAPLLPAFDASGEIAHTFLFTGQQQILGRDALIDAGICPLATVPWPHSRRSLRPDLAHMTRALMHLIRVCHAPAPTHVLVQGDTLSTAAGARAAVKLGIPLIHLEAGLRSYDNAQPYPEELIRRWISRNADLHLAPSDREVTTLTSEGVDPRTVFCVGNPALEQLTRRRKAGERQVVVTLHRRELLTTGISALITAVMHLARSFPSTRFVLLRHTNPRFKSALESLAADLPTNLTVVDPMSRADFVALLEVSSLILTDSGGVQEEAAALGVPTLIMRDRLDRHDGIVEGVVRRVGTDPERVLEAAQDALRENGCTLASLSPPRTGAADRVAQILRRRRSGTSLPESRSRILRRLDAFLMERVVTTDGDVIGAFDTEGRPAYCYPEIAGYTLSWLARLGGQAAMDRSRRIVDCLAGFEGPPPTRYGDGPGLSDDWRNQATFLFDLAMIARGLADCAGRFLNVRERASTVPINAWIAPFFANLSGDTVTAVRLLDGEVPRRWSTTSGPYQLKVFAALLRYDHVFGLDGLQERIGRAADSQVNALVGGVAVPPELWHPTFYACEGLVALGRFDVAQLIVPGLIQQVMEEGGLDYSARLDVLAQATRMALWLNDTRSAVLTDALVQRLHRVCSGEIGDVTTWSLLFASDALHHAFGSDGKALALV